MTVAHTTLVNEIRAFLSSIGALSVKIDTPGLLFDRNGKPVRIGTKGVLDVAACLKGRFVAIDAKIGRDNLDADQRKYAAAVIKAGGLAFPAWSVDDVKAQLTMEGLA